MKTRPISIVGLFTVIVFSGVISGVAGYFGGWFKRDEIKLQLESLAKTDVVYLDETKIEGASTDYEVYVTLKTVKGDYALAKLIQGEIKDDAYTSLAIIEFPNGELASGNFKTFLPEFVLKDGTNEAAEIVDRAILPIKLKDRSFMALKVINGEVKNGKISGLILARALDTGYQLAALVEGGKITKGYVVQHLSFVPDSSRALAHLVLIETEFKYQPEKLLSSVLAAQSESGAEVGGEVLAANFEDPRKVINFEGRTIIPDYSTGTYEVIGGEQAPAVSYQLLLDIVSQGISAAGAPTTGPPLSFEVGSVTSSLIKDLTIVGADIADGTITGLKIANDSIKNEDIADSAIKSAKIEDGTITASDLAATLILSDGDFLDFSAILHDDSALQGLRLPNVSSASPTSPTSGEGFLAYDTSGNQVLVYDGSSWTQIGGSISLYTGSGETTTTSSASGLELINTDELSLLRGCGANQLLKWDETNKLWQCASDNTGAGGASLDSLTAATANSTTQDSNAFTLNWNWDFQAAGSDAGINISESNVSISGLQDEQALVRIGSIFSGTASTASPLQVTSNSSDVGDIFFNLAQSGDLEIRDNGTAFVIFDDTGGTTITGNITANDSSADTILIGQSGTTDDTVTIAGNISLTDDQWSIDGTGAAAGISGTLTGITAGDLSCTNCIGTTEIDESTISSTNLSDGVNIAHINVAETISGGWTFNTAATTFTTAINANGGINSAAATNISFTPGTTGDVVINVDADTLLSLTGGADGTDALNIAAGNLTLTDGDLILSGGDFNVTLDAGDTLNVTKTAASAGSVANIAGTSANAIQGLTLALTSTADTAVDAYQGLNITWTESTDADTFTAVNIGNTTTTNSATTAISIGTGWDTGITVGSGGVTIAVGALAVNSDSITSDGTLTIDSSGTVQLGTDDDFLPQLGAGDADIGATGTRWDNVYGTTGNFTNLTVNSVADPYVDETGDTMTGALAIDPTTTGTFLDFVLETQWTAGDLINADWGSAVTQTAVLVGLNLDFTNLTSVTGSTTYGILINDLAAQTTSTEYAIYQEGTNWDFGLYIDDATQFNSDADFTLAATENITIGNTTAGAISLVDLSYTSTNTTNGIAVAFTDTADAAVDTMDGLKITLTSAADANDTLNAIEIANLTANTAIENAVKIGTSWDYDLVFADTTPTIRVANTGTLTIEDDAAVNGNDIFVLTDVSNAANHILTGDADTGFQISGATTDITTASGETLTLAPGGTGTFVVNTSSTSTSALDLNATGTVAGNAITLDTTNGGIALTAAGATNGDITLSPTDDFTLNGTAGSVLSIGTSNVTQTINIGLGTNVDVSITDPNWSIGTGGAASFASVATGGDTINDFTGNTALVLSGNSLTVNAVTTGTTATTSSNSGLEVGTDGLRLLGGCTSGTADVLKWNGTNWACAADNTGGGGTAWNTISVPSANFDLNHTTNGQYTTIFRWTATGALSPWTMNLTDNAGTATAQNLMTLNNAQIDTANTDVNVESLLLIQQLDTSTGDSKVVDNAVKIDSAGNAGIADGIEITNSVGNITNGINLVDAAGTFTTGINFSGTFTNLISATNFSVTNAGAVTAVGVNSGTGLIQGTGGITTTGAASSINETSNFNTSLNTGTSNGTVTIGGGSAVLAVNTTTIDITAGALTGVTGITLASGNFDQSASSGTFSTGIGSVSLNGDTTVAAGKNLSLAAGVGTATINYQPLGTTAAAKGLTITPLFTLDATDQTLSALYINPNTNSNNDTGDILYGVNVDSITGSSAVESGVRIGTGWDNLISGTTAGTNLLSFTNFTVTSAGAGTFGSTLTVNGATLSIGNGSAATINTPSGNANLTIAPNVTGTLNLATTNTGAVAIGNTTGTFSLTSATGGLNVSTTGQLTGVSSLDTISTSATALTFAGSGTLSSTGASGTLTITSAATTANTALTLNTANQSAGSTSSGGVTLISGNAAGATSTAGNVNIDVGSSTTGTPSINIGASNTNAKAINIGTQAVSTAILIGNSTGGTTQVGQNGGTLQLDGTNFDVATTGVVTLAGAQTADITTLAGTAPTALIFQPGNNTTVSGTGAAFTLRGGNESGTTSTGGAVNINAGTGTSNNGGINIGATTAKTISLGNGTDNTTITLTGTGLTTLGGALTVTGLITANGGEIIAANQALTMNSGTGVFTQTYSSGTDTNSAHVLGITNSASSGTVTINGFKITPNGTSTSGANTLNSLLFKSPVTPNSNNFYALNFETGYTDLLRYNGAQLISGTGVLQSAGLSGTYSGNLTLNGTNSISASTLTATGGTINSTSVGATTPSTGKFTTLTSTGATDLANAGASAVTIATTGTGTVAIGNSTGTLALTSNTVSLSTAGAFTGVTGLTFASGNFDQSASAGTFKTGTGAVSIKGDTTFDANKSLTFTSGTGVFTQNFASSTNNANAQVLSLTNSAASGVVTVNGESITPNGTSTVGTNNLNAMLFNSPGTPNSNNFYGLNFATGYTDILRYNSTQIISGTGVVQSAGISGSYGNLTGTGALASGSIASGFGTILTANTITGTTLNGTTGINTGASSGTQRIDASGNLVSIGNITGTGAITLNTTGNTNGLTLNTATGTSGNSGAITIQTGGTTTSGTSGNILIDVGSGAGANGTVSLGTANASGLTIGRSTVTTTINGTLAAGGVSISGGSINGTTVGASTPSTGAFTTLSATGDVTMNDAAASNILIGATADTVTITSNTLSLTDDNWSIGTGGAAAFNTITEGGTALSSKYAPIGADFITVAANGTLTGETAIGALTTAISTTSTLNVDSSSTLNAVTLDANAGLTMTSGTGLFAQNYSTSSDATADVNKITLSAGGTGSTGTLRGLVISQSDTATAGAFDSLVYIENLKNPEITTNGILITNNAATGFLSNALHITNTAGSLTDAITIDGTAPTGNILNSASLDITGAGAITGATGVSVTAGSSYTGAGAVIVSSGGANTLSLDTGGAAAINIGSTTNATSVSICNSATCDTINIGNLATVDADSILIGDSLDTVTITSNTLSLTDDNWSIGTGGAASFVSVTVGGDTINDFTGNAGLAMSTNALIVDAVTTGTTATTSSNSGLEIGTDGLRLLGGCTSGTTDILKWNGTNWVCSADATGGGGGTLDTAYNAGTATIIVDAYDVTWQLNDATNDYKFVIDNTTTGAIATAFSITTTGVGGTIGTAIDVSDSGITTGISLGATTLGITTGTIGSNAATVINFTNFDVDTAGNITVAVAEGLDTNGSGSLELGKANATSLDICNSAACDTINIGNLATVDADSILIGDSLDTVTITSNTLSLTDDNWSIGTTGIITTTGVINANGGLATSTTDTNLTFSANGAGDFVFNVDSGTLVSLTGGADGTDALNIAAGNLTLADGDLVVSGGDANFTLDAADTLNVTKTAANAGDVVNISGTSVNAIQGLTLALTSTADAAVDAYQGLNITWTESTDADTFTALNIGNTTTTNSTTTAISIGTGWDTGITVGSGGVTIAVGALAVNSDSITSDGNLTIDATSTVIIPDTDTFQTNDVTSTGALTLVSAAASNIAVNPGTTGDVVFTHGDASQHTINITPTADTAQDSVKITLNPTITGSTALLQGMVISQSDNANTGVYDSLLKLENLKTPEITTNGILIQNNAASGTLSNALHITNTAGTLTSAIVIDGATAPGNFILDTASIDITGAGAITGATGVSSTTGTFSSALAANGGITFDHTTDTLGAFTAAGVIDMNTSYYLTKIGNAGTNFDVSGGLTLASTLVLSNNTITCTGCVDATDLAADSVDDSELVNTLSYSGTLTITTNALAVNSDSITSDGVLTINATSAVRLGDGTNYFEFSESGGPTYVGTARPTRTVTLIPEYSGATLTGDTTSNTGTMTSDFCSDLRGINTATTPTNAFPCDSDLSEEHNYYTWTSTLATQDYDIWVRWQVPSDFSGWDTLTNAIQVYGWRTDATNTVTVSMFDTAGAAVGSATNVATGTGQWTQTTVVSTPTGTYTIGGYVTFRIQMANDTANDHVKVGEIEIDYKAKF